MLDLTCCTLLPSVLFFVTDASEELVLMSGEKGMELNDVRSDLHPDRTPVLHHHHPPLALRDQVSPGPWLIPPETLVMQ